MYGYLWGRKQSSVVKLLVGKRVRDDCFVFYQPQMVKGCGRMDEVVSLSGDLETHQ